MQHRQNHHRAVAGFVTCSGWVVGLVLAGPCDPPTALAGDDKIFAPQSCLPRETPDDDVGDANVFVNAIQRTLTDDSLFVCPLIRDVVTGDLDAVWVRVSNNDGDDASPSCCVYSYSPLGTDVDFDCEGADADEVQQTLAFDLDGFEESDHGYYVLTCQLGYEDTIFSYRISESD